MNSETDLKGIRAAAAVSVEIMQELVEAVKPGITGEDIDRLAGEACAKRGVTPSFKGVPSNAGPFPGNLCFCINDQVLHAIPYKSQVVASGDVVKVDFGIVRNGYYTDHCISLGIGEVAEADKKLLQIGKLAVESAVAKVKAGARTGDLGSTVQSIAEIAGFSVVAEFIGHGIGKRLHLPPDVPAVGRAGTGALLKEGMVICVEAQIIAGSNRLYIESDGWGLRTRDGSNAVMFEYMVEVQKGGYKVLTPTQNWNIFRN